MNNTSYQPSKHQSGDDSRRIASSGASASFEALQLELEAEIFSLEMLRVRMASEYSSPSNALSQDTAAAADKARVASDMQILRIPTKSEDCKPGPTLNPASCASGLALLGGGGGGEGSDWISALSLTALVAERMNSGQGQGNTRRRNSSLQNEDWGDLYLPRGGNLFLGNGGN
eukprot:scaffold4702_cov111-Skeletonema_dohrnii-CCMP3373.AAC.6